MARVIQLWRLALADLRHDRAITLCQVVALAAILAPLLVLQGLERGVIGTMIDRLDRDPAMRLILPEVTGANRFDAAWFAKMKARADVAFVLPSTRAIAGQVDMLPTAGGLPAPLRVSWLPTAAGDPVAADGQILAEGFGQIGLSADAARQLRVKPGDKVVAAIERVRDGKIEPVALTLTVRAVAPADRFAGQAGFVSLELLEAVQDYRDGYAVPALGGQGTARPTVSSYPLFRLYTRTIEQVAGLAADLGREGIVVSTRANEIAAALGLRANLLAILLIVAALAGGGYALSLAASQYANAERKRRDLAILSLVGYGPGWLATLPLAQGLVLAVAGIVVASGLFFAAATAINSYFAGWLAPGEAACRLTLADGLLAAAATLALSLVPALAVGVVYGRLQPSHELRDV